MYALLSSSDGAVRYVGQTVSQLHTRLATHIRHSRRYPHRHLSCWIKKAIADGHAIQITALEEAAHVESV